MDIVPVLHRSRTRPGHRRRIALTLGGAALAVALPAGAAAASSQGHVRSNGISTTALGTDTRARTPLTVNTFGQVHRPITDRVPTTAPVGKTVLPLTHKPQSTAPAPTPPATHTATSVPVPTHAITPKPTPVLTPTLATPATTAKGAAPKPTRPSTSAPAPAPSTSRPPAKNSTPPPSPTPSATSSTGTEGQASGTGCLAKPSACGYPDASNTGSHGTLTASGSITSTTNGQVIENLDVHGHISVTSANVTIRNVRVTQVDDQFGGIDLRNATGHTTVSDVTVVASLDQLADITARDTTIERANLSGAQDGIDSWAGKGYTGYTVIADSYIHDLARNTAVSSHDDTIQTSGGDETFRHNTLIPFTGGDPMNACLQIGDLQGDLIKLVFDNNLCDGGNYSINANANNVKLGNVSAGPMTFTNNRFGRDYRYGVETNLGSPFRTTWTGNVDDATGKAV
jgi:hypothetical protein